MDGRPDGGTGIEDMVLMVFITTRKRKHKRPVRIICNQ